MTLCMEFIAIAITRHLSNSAAGRGADTSNTVSGLVRTHQVISLDLAGLVRTHQVISLDLADPLEEDW